jgi:hypothetical protein
MSPPKEGGDYTHRARSAMPCHLGLPQICAADPLPVGTGLIGCVSERSVDTASCRPRAILRRRLGGGKRRGAESSPTGRVSLSRAALIDVYISGLNLTEVAVVSDGRRCRIHTGEPAPGEKIAARFYFRPTHADLLLMTIGQEGLSGKQPAALDSADELYRVAEQAVAEVVERVNGMNQSGGLKQLNAQYRRIAWRRLPGPKRRSHTRHFWRDAPRRSCATSR